MPAQTIFFIGDKFHASQTAPSVHSISTTASGYNRESVRDTSFLDAWKPANSTNDEYIQVDGGSAGWLGTTVGDTIHFAIAYDARGCDQTEIVIASDATDPADGVTGVTFLQIKLTLTINATGPTSQYGTFVIPAGGKRHYRVFQFNATRGGGTKTVPIYAIAFFTASEVYIIDTEYLGNSPGPGAYDQIANVGIGATVGGMWQTNVNGPPSEEFDVNIPRATPALWALLRSSFQTWHNGPSRAIWLQYEGITNAALSHFGMVQQVSFGSRRPLKDQYDTSMRFRVCGKPL